MKKLLTLFTATVAFSLLPSVSQAVCVSSGHITRASVAPGPGPSTFAVRSSTPGSISFLYLTADAKVLDAALSAQASHARVQVTGALAACGGVIGGSSAGGPVTNIVVAP